ncbi:Scarecrow-like transcription factor PAT1 [Bienertia sinuspersici]
MQNSRNHQAIYCTFESSLLDGVVNNLCGSPSTGSISGNGSTVSVLDPEYSSSDSHDNDTLRHQLRELETVMMEPSDNSDTESWQQLMELISRGELRSVLIACAKAVSDDDLLTAEWLISELQQMVSVSGEPIQRLGAYMLEGLIARLSSSGISIYNALNCKEPTGGELLSYMQLLYEICPYFKFGYMSANGAIADALKNEDKIHIIDFQIAQGSQWVSLIQALAARPGGPPRVRITGIDDTTSEYARGGGLNLVGERLSQLANSCNLPFEFHAAALSFSPEVQLPNIVLKPEEALAVNFPFRLHHIPDESVGPENHRDTLLRLVKSWSPKVVTLVEYELNTNTAPFFPRFLESLNYYSAIFESINATLPRDHRERINVEQHCLAREIVNIIACEGAERFERHELHGKWRSRFSMAGFRPYPLSPLVNATIRTLLQKYSSSYGLEERDGALYLGWMNRALVTSCAWK